MKPGEYVGADGMRCRWVCQDDGCVHQLQDLGNYRYWYEFPIDPADWPAAKAALDALVEAESGEWVTWELHAGTAYRCRPDGAQPEVCNNALTDPQWDTIGAPVACSSFYRKGREVALDEVRELVEAVLRAVDNPRVDPRTQRDVRAAAKALEAKLDKEV